LTVGRAEPVTINRYVVSRGENRIAEATAANR
jgi:hypothetical protein